MKVFCILGRSKHCNHSAFSSIKLEENLVKGSILLHCLNPLLKHSAVLVLPLSKFDLDKSGKLVTMDIPLPLKNADGSISPVEKELGISEEESSKLKSLLSDLADTMELWTVGYIRLLKLFNDREPEQFPPEEKYDWVPLSVEFGMPLFSPTMCNDVCRRLVSSELFQSGSFSEHHHAVQSLRRKLHDISSEYQATRPAAKVLYQKEQLKESSRQLMNYASGRWNPLVDPSSPISEASRWCSKVESYVKSLDRPDLLDLLVRPSSEDAEMEDVEDHRPSKRKVIYSEHKPMPMHGGSHGVAYALFVSKD
ncbi:hypothetical protein KIW84_073180 [Lathyrus oleraceus]|uniref:FAM91 C-terminal domain-containing protein n=1 Tax=Pisum sativum TaxID=3888 RepID=A0A9D4VNG0_PEA|nr:hypothetical protein KIW84_073180 [Pisum sativum]